MAIKHMKMRYDYRHTKRRPYRFLMRCGFSMGILQARILEWVAMPSSKGSSQPRNWTQVFSIAGRFFTIWSPREAPREMWRNKNPYKHLTGVLTLYKISCMTNNWILGILPPQMYTIVYKNYMQDILIRLFVLTKSWYLLCTLTAVPINFGIIVHWDVIPHWKRTTVICLKGIFFNWRIITLYTVHGVLPMNNNTGVVCHSLLQWTTFVRTLHYDPSILGGPEQHGS